jgi:hypothetical protein
MARLGFRRKLYIFDVERYDRERDAWNMCGAVLLPDSAYRSELSRALLVFGLHAPRPSDQVSWSYRIMPSSLPLRGAHRERDAFRPAEAGALGPLPWPRAWITGLNGTPIVRLSARAPRCRARAGFRNHGELGRERP